MLQQRAKAHGVGHFRTVNRIIHLLTPWEKEWLRFGGNLSGNSHLSAGQKARISQLLALTHGVKNLHAREETFYVHEDPHFFLVTRVHDPAENAFLPQSIS